MSDYGALLRELAASRLVGTPHHARARALLDRELTGRGYTVLQHAFPVTPPGGLAPPLYGGALLAWASLATALFITLTSTAAASAACLAAAGALAAGRPRRRAVTGINLIAVRPRERVTVWLAAHYDSKGQPLSMALRLGAVLLAALGAVSLLVLGGGHAAGVAWSRPAALALAAPGVAGGLLLFGARVTDRSPGAVDNASALVTVLAILDRLPPTAPVGVLFTDAEEYGLLGATALARERPNLLAGTAVLNFDGVDDRGATRCVAHRDGPLVRAVGAALSARPSRLLPLPLSLPLPVVVDGWVFARAARECATIMRGDWRTAAVVHTPRDTADRLTLRGSDMIAARVAEVLARVDVAARGA